MLALAPTLPILEHISSDLILLRVESPRDYIVLDDQEFDRQLTSPNQDELISLREASEFSGLSSDHLRRLAGRGDLWAKKIGRDWLTTIRAVQEYLARDRRPGPKNRN